MRVGLFKSGSNAGRPNSGLPSIRGKISGPIPIPSPDDDEFPMRHSGTGVATPVGTDGKMPSKLQPPPEGSSTVDIPNNPTSPSPEARSHERAESATHTGPSHSSHSSGSPARRRTNASSTLRYSTVSTGTGTDPAPQRKKSTLRSALSKLFGRKKKNTSIGSLSESPNEAAKSSVQHRSDPSALGPSFAKESEPKRSASLPITEYDRALRSHSIGPDDMLVIESARNSLQSEPIRNRRRAATITSQMYLPRSREFGDIAGLSPRPASTHGRDSRQEAHGEEDPEQIGRAVTSDLFTSRRRSRSLSQLPGSRDGHDQRKRSDEIRYWRESYDPGFLSPTSSNQNDDTGVISLDTPESPVEVQPKTPPRPFNFQNMIGMKITQAVTLEERIGTLETKNEKLEKLVAQLFHVLPGVNNYAGAPDRAARSFPIAPSFSSSSAGQNAANYHTLPSEHKDPSYYSSSRQSNESFGNAPTFVGSIPPYIRPSERPTSNATVRVATSLPTLPRELSGPFTADHYTTLLALIETERAARQILETQVTKLTHQLNLVSRISHKYELQTGQVSGTYSAFEHDDEDETHAGDEDFSESEAFKTPREENPHGFGAFGEELKEDEPDGSRKKAARTLSLSQLTLKKPPKSDLKAVAGVDL